ncbi:MAG: efflux RND transporter periplasmic adaptor subunit [Candidatus Riflebacteria bacterium]|nr:efflux RND transporter periplasmic adaptor subunit [Candidatus Riflebacteria bacterium]
MKNFLILLVIVLFLSGASYAGFQYYKARKAAVEYLTETADVGEILQTVSAVGTLAAFTTVDVGCQVSGIISSLTVDFNDRVTANQEIALIDPSIFEAQVLQATANLEAAKAQEKNLIAQLENQKATLISTKAEIDMQSANIKKAEATLEDAKRNKDRNEDLFKRHLVAAADRDTAVSNYQALFASLDAAKAQLALSKAKIAMNESQIDAAKAQIEGAQAQIKQMNVQLNIAQINLSRTRIYSPIDGVIIARKVDVGQTVAASLQAPSLYSIAKDLKKMQINTSVDEADIGMVSPNQTITFTVAAYPKRTFHGKVDQIRLSSTITQNVVTYSVMVNVENDDLALYPGMTANVDILVDSKDNVCRIPTKAMFYKPSNPEFTSREKKHDDKKDNEKKDNEKIDDEKNDDEKDGSEKIGDEKNDDHKDGEKKDGEKKDEKKRDGKKKHDRKEKYDNGIWLLASGKPKFFPIKIGLSTTKLTELIEPPLPDGAKIIVGEKDSKGNVTGGGGGGGSRGGGIRVR